MCVFLRVFLYVVFSFKFFLCFLIFVVCFLQVFFFLSCLCACFFLCFFCVLCSACLWLDRPPLIRPKFRFFFHLFFVVSFVLLSLFAGLFVELWSRRSWSSQFERLYFAGIICPDNLQFVVVGWRICTIQKSFIFRVLCVCIVLFFDKSLYIWSFFWPVTEDQQFCCKWASGIVSALCSFYSVSIITISMDISRQIFLKKCHIRTSCVNALDDHVIILKFFSVMSSSW